MNAVGLWPDLESHSKSRTSWFNFCFTLFMVIAFFTVPQTADLWNYWDEIDLIAENLMTNIGVALAVVKLLVVRYHKKELSSLVAAVTEDWMAAKTAEERLLMLGNAKISRKISIFCMILANLMMFMFLAYRVYLSIRMGREDGTGFAKELLYVATFPYDTKKSPNYEITLIAQSLSCYCALIVYTCVDSFITMLIIHVSGQLSGLRVSLEHLADGQIDNSNVYWVQLGSLVEKHRRLYRFTRTIENCFNVMLLAQILACTFNFCMEGFRFVMTLSQDLGDMFTLFQLVFLVIHISYIQFHMFIYCYVGEVLLGESLSIGDACFQCQWYNLTAKQAHALVLVIRRAKTPFVITAGKFTNFSLGLFTNILKTSVGYLSVLLTVQDRSEDA